MSLSQKVIAILRPFATFAAIALVALGTLMTAASPLLAATPSSRGIQWTEEFDAAFQKAGVTNQVIMLHFYGDNCPPCKLLDKKTFHDPKLIAALNDNVIAVKINADKQREIADRFQVKQWPTDIYLHPNGEEIHRRVSPQDPAVYCQVIDRVALRHRDWTVEKSADLAAKQRRQDRALAASSPRNQTTQPTGSADGRPIKTQSTSFQPPAQSAPAIVVPPRTVSNPFATEQTANTAPAQPQPQPTAPRVTAPSVTTTTPPSLQQSAPLQTTAPKLAEVAAANPPSAIGANPSPAVNSYAQNTTNDSANSAAASTKPESTPAVGMEGFCPVSLRKAIQTREGNAWCQGSPEFAVRHRGRVYFCASEEYRQALLQNPDHYTPAVSCYDIVHFMRTGQLVDGKCEFGCIQEDTGKVFLFADQTNSDEFKRASEYYSKWLDNENQERVANDPTGATLR